MHGLDRGREGRVRTVVMVIALVVVALVAVAAAGALAWTAAKSAGASSLGAAERLLEASLRMHEMRPETVVVPPPDLSPYLDQMSEMAQAMARELAQGISLIVQGPPSVPDQALRGDESVGAETATAQEPVEYPSWETDDTWGIQDLEEQAGEWSAHTVPSALLEGPFGGNGFGSGGIRLPDNEGL